MKCKFINKLYDFLNNEIDEKNKNLIKEHLKTCKICNDELYYLTSIKTKFKKNMINPSSSLIYKIKKDTKTNNWMDYIFLHKKILSFSATFTLIIAGMIFFNSVFKQKNYSLNEFLYDVYSFNSVEENISDTVAVVDIFNND